ncbi:aminomethyl-transferring glycine dehydrogenase [Enteractinococcus coprophilus]|uniref:Glycine dehydrogenase (decarboxylating) n=1 Tax=Enteractinococcus coprophilus TaxID=1027633 RepID=A0A543A0F6_9MICC|nr:aminomethyl-transferring glycine dehydrogenase [Enteractinococcus coprophilus]TQL66073.1 glycine dehydrogenase [Enteractinococcus coprophilus]
MTIHDLSKSAVYDRSNFAQRHLGPRESGVEEMLEALGYDSLDALTTAAVPENIAQQEPLVLPDALTETQTQARLRELASKNTLKRSMIGQGFYDTITPAVIRRNVTENPGWYTAYTPYQPEISQGRLEALLNFQTMVSDLTGMEIANASLLDESSAAAEAVLMMRRANRKHANDPVVIDKNIFPQTLAVVLGHTRPLGIETILVDLATEGLPEGDICGVLVQQPGDDGALANHQKVFDEAKERGAMISVIADLLALTMITPPGEQGADIAVGTTQRFGVPLFYGGPHAAYMATRERYVRQMPGRLVGVSKDANGLPAYRLALQTREQHIRREKATSNICTAQALLAVMAGMYGVYHGPEGVTEIAQRTHSMATRLAASLRDAGYELAAENFFDTIVVTVKDVDSIMTQAVKAGYNLRRFSDSQVGISADETTTEADIEAVAEVFGATLVDSADSTIQPELVRESAFMTHEIFNTIRSETTMMRYCRRLADRDLALDRTMIPLGSCTMKLNAAAEMEAITWPELAGIHPYAPDDQAAGWIEMIKDLESKLEAITGYAAVSLQPNAGSAGEYAGLLAIRHYLIDKGEEDRDICIIPASAHGTNAASAVLAGLQVIVVKTADDGSIDSTHLDEVLDKYGERIAAIMVTYPSTAGIYDADVAQICEKIHNVGGQVYIDGANLNALIGLAQPGKFGGDVSHLNLHKTFSIPHGGGGPGVGPVCVAEHLVPYLPADPRVQLSDNATPVASTLYGSAGVLPISWAYITMMGADALKEATQVAVLSANYVAHRLKNHYPLLYTGLNDLVAHECILDLREITKNTGVTVEDVAKRLMDFGFHAPTMAFPVPGTLMVEPTESEDMDEMERFITAMITIREEITDIENGKIAVEESALRHAPHPVSDVVSSDWDRAYSVEQAAFPVPELRVDKYFTPVSRIDQAGGDRNLVCSCPPPEAFELQ